MSPVYVLPDIADLLEPLERAITLVLIPALLEHQVAETERDLFALPVHMGGLGLVNPVNQSRQEYEASIKATGPLVKQIANKHQSQLTMRMSLARSDARVKRKLTVRGTTKNT